ncbi:MAG: NACHT domain-containing protein, partial [Nitrospira sp.]|nr:NACHT domain-containing protein [Nitrospira sp.]
LGDLRLPLESVYIRLQAIGELPPVHMLFDVETLKARGMLPAPESTFWEKTHQLVDTQHPNLKPLPVPVPVEVALQQSHHLVVLGEPGSGKTTLLRYLALQFAQQQAKSILGLTTERLPIYLRLVDYAEALVRDVILSLCDFIVKALAAAASSPPPFIIEEELRQGRCILLLDGLDEVSRELRQKVVDQIDDFLNSSDYSPNRVVVTSRIAGYQTVRLKARSAKTYTLHPFQPTDIETFARKWFRGVAGAQGSYDPDSEAECQTRIFLEQTQRPDISRLLDTPLMLQLAIAVFTNKGTLPDSRARLYSDYFEPILSERAEARVKPPCDSIQIRRILAAIAWIIHQEGRPNESQLLEMIKSEIGEANSDAVLTFYHL